MTRYAFHLGLQQGLSVMLHLTAEGRNATTLQGMSEAGRYAIALALYTRDTGPSSYKHPTPARLGSLNGWLDVTYWLDLQNQGDIFSGR